MTKTDVLPIQEPDLERNQGAEEAPSFYAEAEQERLLAEASEYLESIGPEGAAKLRSSVERNVSQRGMSYAGARINHIYLDGVPKDVFDFLFGYLKPKAKPAET